MLICDAILQRKCPELTQLAGEHFDQLHHGVAKAQKFVLDRSLAETADGLDDDEVERVLGQCRLPFPIVWLECLHNDRPRFRDAPLEDEHRQQLMFRQYRPKRIALLVEAIDDSRLRFGCHLFWSFPEKEQVSGAVFMQLCDLSANEDTQNSIKLVREKLGISTDYMLNPKGERISQAELALANRSAPIPSLYYKLVLDHLADNVTMRQKLLENSLADWAHETTFWWGVLALLNCRNVIEMRHVDVSGLNRSRAKQQKPLFAEHKILHLRLPGKINAASKDGTGTHASPRGHFVRGHFKARKNGLFYWHDFFRGDPVRTVSKTYIVGYDR